MLQKSPQMTALIQAAQAGSREDFARLVELHYDQMFRFALKYLGDRTSAEDVTQQACIKLAGSIGQFRFDAAFSSWLYRLVINCAKDQLKARHIRREEALTHAGDQDLSSAGNPAEHEKQLEQTLGEIDRLGEGYRDAVVLVLGEGLTHAEAGKALGIAESTVSWRIHEVRKHLGGSREDA